MGEIMRAQTVVAQARAEVNHLKFQASQDVRAALNRYADARKWADSYGTEVLPDLASTKDNNKMEKQFQEREHGSGETAGRQP